MFKIQIGVSLVACFQNRFAVTMLMLSQEVEVSGSISAIMLVVF